MYLDIIEKSLFGMYGLGQTISVWTIYVLVGLSVAVAFKTGYFNIGVAGQMIAAALLAHLTIN